MARRASPLLSLAEARLNTRKQVKDLRLRVRAFGAIVGGEARLARRVRLTRIVIILYIYLRARHAAPLLSLAEARLNTKQTNIIFAQIQRNNVIAI